MKKYIFPLAITMLLASCAGNQKKILVLSNNNPVISDDQKTITCKATSGHEERSLDFTGDAIKVSTGVGDATINTPDKGYYIINLKAKDTIIGSYQHFAVAGESQHVMSQDDLKKNVDSLKQLMEGKNVTEANRNFFIPPNTGVKITSNLKAYVVAPYHQIQTSEMPTTDDGSAPEVYQFYTMNEVRDILARLVKLTGTPPPPPAPPKK